MRSTIRTDLIIDYLGIQYVIEMKIWHGQEYNTRVEKQLVGYLKDYGLKKGYMLSFNFNKNKTPGRPQDDRALSWTFGPYCKSLLLYSITM